jgi:hypothetical protein
MPKILDKIYNYLKYPAPIPYSPQQLETPSRYLDIVSAWHGHHLILADLIQRFGISTQSCLEFGVEFGFSAVAMSSYFDTVTGVDIFMGDIHTQHKGDHYTQTKARLQPYINIHLVKADYQDYIQNNNSHYNLIHVDIVHTFEHTYRCGLWSAQHSQCTIFHDTESFPEVKRAVHEIAKQTNKKFYNYTKHYGLGILV